MTTAHQQSDQATAPSRRAVVLDYFDLADGRRQGNMLELFAEDAQVYFPKFGVGRGHEALGRIGGGLMQVVRSIKHDPATFTFIEMDDYVVVEGTSEGVTADGTNWRGGETPGGRFCSVFEIKNGKIQRMHVYLDPDYGNADAARYPWPVMDEGSY